MSKSKIFEHNDRLNRPLHVGDCVVFPVHNNLRVGIIEKIMPVMVRIIVRDHVFKYKKSIIKYPSDVSLVEGPEVTMYMLKLNGQ